MRQDEFAIGLEFYCDARRWRCTDVGTRVVIAIALDHEDDPTWYSGPPYAVAERVFDEEDQEGCSLIPEEIDCFAPVSLNEASGANSAKVDAAVLALLYLTLHDGCRAWKSFDWNAMNRLHEKGFIFDPVNKAKSVQMTPAGIFKARQLVEELFGFTSVGPETDNRT
jgi:hypothetical protein